MLKISILNLNVRLFQRIWVLDLFGDFGLDLIFKFSRDQLRDSTKNKLYEEFDNGDPQTNIETLKMWIVVIY